MAVLSVCESEARPDFSRSVLRGLAEMGSPCCSEGELFLDLGVSLWISRSGECLQDAVPELLAMRSALIKVSALADEPVPFWGSDPRRDVLNLAAYLRGLVSRAAVAAGCAAGVIVERAIALLEDQEPSTARISALR
jgi:hypothetical protein